MGLIANALRRPSSTFPSMGSMALSPMQPSGSFEAFARQGYMNNEIVFAAIDLLATSVAEPQIMGKRWRRNKPEIRRQAAVLTSKGIPEVQVNNLLVTNGYYEEVDDHPLVELLNNPNPFVSRFQFWSSAIVDYYLAGNVFLLKARSKFGNVPVELWRLRPDRVKIIPSSTNFIEAYEWTPVGGKPVRFQPEDIIHWKTRNPLDDYYGMPPLMAASQRIAIDNYMKGFLKRFFETGGTGPGAILTVEGKVSQEGKDEIRERFKRQFGGPAGWFEMLVLDNSKSTYQQLGLNRGLRDALPKEIDAMTEARLAMVLHIPGSILGLLIGYETSSYANQRQAWQVFWDITLRPLYSDLDAVLNLSLLKDFNGIDEVCFDISQVYALQEDVDKLHARARENLRAGGWTIEEFRNSTGQEEMPKAGMFLLPGGTVAVPVERLGEEPEPAPAPEPAPQLTEAVAALMIAAPRRGRPSLEDDDSARSIWEEATALKVKYPTMTWDQVAARVGVVDRTLRKYRAVFEDE